MLQIRSKYTWFNGDLQYVSKSNEEAEAVSYYPNGRLKFKYPLRNSSLEGLCVVWFEDGNKMSEEVYAQGRLHGSIRHWHENGMIKSQCQYRFGFPHGIRKEYDQDGKLISQKLLLRAEAVPKYLEELLKSNSLEAKHIVKIRNAEIRRILLEDMGYERFLQQLPHEVIHKEGEQDLVRVNLHHEEEPLVLVKVRCPSTGAFYTLRVPPGMKTVKEAVAWTFGVDEKEYFPEEEA
ncbi:MAG: hypothetical protein HQL24_09950 [Candidatus Omnitrophica bacterium]|nr:hypothetical protein [Candidatus Omnitrophota bacterium]